jgi:hypothetical protein
MKNWKEIFEETLGKTNEKKGDKYTHKEMLQRTKAKEFPGGWSILDIIKRYDEHVIGYLKENPTLESVEVNEKKVMDLDVLLNRFQDSDYSPSNSSLKDLENFIDFIREYTPKGSIIETVEVNENKTAKLVRDMESLLKPKNLENIQWELTKAVDAWYSQGEYEKSDVIKYFKATIEENDLKDWLAKHPEAAAALKRRGITK